MQNGWILRYEGFDPSKEKLRETLCTLGNGYFATRGAAPGSQADGIHYPGTYIAGCYNRLKTEIAGYTVENEDLVNAPNWLPLNFRIEDGPWLELHSADILEYIQELDLRRGILTRRFRFREVGGRITRVVERRFVHILKPHLAGLETTVVAENWSGRLTVRTALDARVENAGVERYRRLNGKHLVPVETIAMGEEGIYLQVQTNQSHIRIAQAARIRIHQNGESTKAVKREFEEHPSYISQEISMQVGVGQPVTIEKVVSLFTSRDWAVSECGLSARSVVMRAGSFDSLMESHILEWDHLWRRFDIDLNEDYHSALVLRLHFFHLLQTVSPNSIDLDVGVPARGLHGEAYRGHIFWDELFIFPLLNLRLSDLTRALLLYRYRRLDEARWAASQAGYEGAMFPWQSASDGHEESPDVHLNPRSGRWVPDNSHLQRHINSAIAYNVWNYCQVTGDIDFLSYYGGEMVLEIARFWASITHYNRSADRYEIHRVMGPDEYHDAYPDAKEPGLHNNAYTNIMAVWVLMRATEVLKILPEDRHQSLLERLGLRREELDRWDDITRKMYVPFHDHGIISQFEGYDGLHEFNWEAYRGKYGDIQRLDRILEAEGDTPNRYKVSKQADVLMLFYLLSADELRELFHRLNYPFEYDTIPRNIDYYLRRTCHGSTLSRVVHSWVLSRSNREESWLLFQNALESDVSDTQGGTTPEGIHLGAMAGTVDLVQRCYTGIEPRGDVLHLSPSLPSELAHLEFSVRYRQHILKLSITPRLLRLSSRPGRAAPIQVSFKGQKGELKTGDTWEIEIQGKGAT